MYKRGLLCFALAVLLCLGLCACGSGLPLKQLNILQGTWFNEMAFNSVEKPEEGVPYLFYEYFWEDAHDGSSRNHS